jgi:hypothetical protein
MAALLGFAAHTAFAGGFFLTLGTPVKGAFVTVRADGCHEPEKAQISATAEGLVDGQRRSVALKLRAMPSPGVYAVPRDWPAEGAWVVRIVAMDKGRSTGAVIPVLPGGFRRGTAKLVQRAPAESDIAAALEVARGVESASLR